MTKLKWITFLTCFALVASLLIFTGCGKESKVRKYKEKTASGSPHAGVKGHASQGKTASPGEKMPVNGGTPGHGMGTSHAARSHFSWKTPDGWTEKQGGGGLRLATFTVQSGDETATCTIIPLKGEAGGLAANVQRWMGQILPTGDEAEAGLKKVLDAQEKFLTDGKFPAALVDFTPVTPKGTDKSILATVVSVQGNSIFIKMVGLKSLLAANKEKFKALCMSFSVKANVKTDVKADVKTGVKTDTKTDAKTDDKTGVKEDIKKGT